MLSTVRIKERPKMDWRHEGTCNKLNKQIRDAEYLSEDRKSQLIHELTNQFYPTRHSSIEDIRNAKRICAECPVRTQCLSYSLTNWEKMGIWGGRTEIERRSIRRDARNNKVSTEDLEDWLDANYPITRVVTEVRTQSVTEVPQADLLPS